MTTFVRIRPLLWNSETREYDDTDPSVINLDHVVSITDLPLATIYMSDGSSFVIDGHAGSIVAYDTPSDES